MTESRPQIPFKIRLKAWWEGYDPADLMRLQGATEPGPASPPSSDASQADDRPEPAIPHSRSHVAFMELAWGQGFVEPSSEEFVLDLARPIGLGPEHNVLEIGAGLGGGTRAIAKAFGVWIEGIEANAVLAEHGMERSVRAGLGERAPIRRYDPAVPDFQTNRYDAVFSKEAIFRIDDKERLFHAVKNALKPGGQLLFTDFVLAGDADDAAAAWRDGGREQAHLWGVDPMTRRLTGAGFEVRVCEDISERYRRVVLGAWARLLGKIQRRELPPRWHNYLTAVTEFEQKRMAALEGGTLKVYRFHAYG